MTTTTRTQNRYDHRLRDLVRTTRDINCAVQMGVPPSTARGWLTSPTAEVITSDVLDIKLIPLQREVLQLRARVRKLTALSRVLLAVMRACGCSLSQVQIADGKDKRALLGSIDCARSVYPLQSLLRAIRLSASRYHNWRRKEQCAAFRRFWIWGRCVCSGLWFGNDLGRWAYRQYSHCKSRMSHFIGAGAARWTEPLQRIRKRAMRTAKELLTASKEFASENRWLSWWHLLLTLGALGGLFAIAVSDLPILLRAAASLLAGLVAMRLFIIYHDFQHGAILRDSPVAGFLMGLFGVMMLNPPSVWNPSHNHHHKNNSKGFGANIGSFPIMTEEAYKNATSTERFAYAVTRHPLTIALGYFTVFLWWMSLRPFLRHPVRHFDGGLAVLLNLGLMAHLGSVGLDVMLFGMVIPLAIASSLGAYLFYAQHNFPTAKLAPQSEWSHVKAALHSSSFMSMSPLMNWFTGNIGYHHVHHLNARIPFYRLPEAMNALEELQSPGRTSLHPRDIAACLRLKLWSSKAGRLVNFKGI